MQSFAGQVLSYADYHHDWRNKLTHFLGVPLVTFSLFLFLAWFRFVHADLPLTAATLFYVCVLIYYFALDWRIALIQTPFSVALLWIADRAAILPFAQSLWIFGATFVGGWLIQLLGHVFEGKRPALADNIMQIFNAPLFLTVEVLLLLGYRQEFGSDERRPEATAIKSANVLASDENHQGLKSEHPSALQPKGEF